jgi:hypothetical protein
VEKVMAENNRSGVVNVIKGVLLKSVPGSLFSTALLLSYAYASQLIYTIGDVRQLGPLFLGVVVGAVLYSLVAFLLKPTYGLLLTATAVSSVLLTAAYLMMVRYSFVLDGTIILVVTLMLTSIYLPVGIFLDLGRPAHLTGGRAILGVSQSLLSILFILLFSIYYEETGQLNFYFGPLIFLLLSLISFFVILAVNQSKMPARVSG